MEASNGEAGGRLWRWVAILLLLLLVLHGARSAFVRTEAERKPELASTLWPSHPAPRFTLALAGIGAAAREGRGPDAPLLASLERAARSAPIAPEPLWVAAADRLERRDYPGAERLLKAAIRLDARAPAARFLMADLAIRQGNLAVVLDELAALERRVPGMSRSFAPALVTFVRQPGAVAQIGPFLGRNPALRESLLANLSKESRDLPILVSLTKPGDERSSWFPEIAQRLLANGEVASVRALYAKVNPGRSLDGTTLSSWSAQRGTDLFGWRFPEGKGGVAEPTAGGPLRLVHYGREEMVMAEHLLLLSPGSYRLSAAFAAPLPSGAFEWRLLCLKGNRSLGILPVVAGQGGGDLNVPGDCQVQILQLVGRGGDVARAVQSEVRAVTLTRAGATAR